MACPTWANIKIALKSTHYATIVLALFLYFVVLGVRNSYDPYDRDYIWTDGTIRHTSHDDTIPYWLTGFFTIPACVVLFMMEYLRCRKLEAFDILWLYNGWLLSVDLISACIFTFNVVEVAKLAVGRLRPDFLDRCKPDLSGITTVSEILNSVNPPCTVTDKDELNKGRVSFPSGHTAQCFAVAVYLTSYQLWWHYVRKRMQGEYRTYESSQSCGAYIKQELQELMRLFAIFVPLGIAFFVGLTRIRDNHHSPDDMLGGVLIGSVFSMIFFVRALFAFVAVQEENGNALPGVRQSITMQAVAMSDRGESKDHMVDRESKD